MPLPMALGVGRFFGWLWFYLIPIRKTVAEQNLQREIEAETNAHAIFILFALLIGAPLLFGVSLQFISIFHTLFTKLNIEELSQQAALSGGAGTISISTLAVSPDFFMYYALGILAMSNFFGALLVGLIKTGRPISGVPNIPVLIFISVAVFLLINYVLGLFFGSLFTG